MRPAIGSSEKEQEINGSASSEIDFSVSVYCAGKTADEQDKILLIHILCDLLLNINWFQYMSRYHLQSPFAYSVHTNAKSKASRLGQN